MKYVWRITTIHRHGQTHVPIWFLFQCDHADLASLVAALNEGKLVIGQKLWTRPASDDQVECLAITSRHDIALSSAAIADIVAPHKRVVEFLD